jgi:Ca2+-binding EF-hand superfamily protein
MSQDTKTPTDIDSRAEAELKSLFKSLDADHDQKLRYGNNSSYRGSPDEIRTYLKSLRLPYSDFHVKNVMDAVDLDHDGFITFEELKTFAAKNTKDLYVLFHEIDVNNDGKLSLQEVRSNNTFY